MALFDLPDQRTQTVPRPAPGAMDLDDDTEEPQTLRQVFEDQPHQRARDRIDNPVFQRWATSREPRDLKKVVESLEPTIDHLVRQYAGTRVSPVVHQRARLLAAKAVGNYNPIGGASLQTHVSNQLRALQRMLPAITDPLPPPERFRYDQRRIVQATNDLEDELDREVTDEEVSLRIGMPLRRVIKVRQRMRARLPTSTVEESDEDDNESPDIVGSTRTRFDEWVDAVYHDLGPVDQLILSHKTGYRGAEPLSTSELARRLKLSDAAVSQRAARIQHRLDEYEHGPQPRHY